jgi:proteic killer suppression protein
MIESFRHKGLRRLFESDDRRQLRPDLVERIRVVLGALDAANTIEVMNRPSFRLHPLKGDWRGYWAVTVNANWRIVFRFEEGSVFDVDLIDYH